MKTLLFTLVCMGCLVGCNNDRDVDLKKVNGFSIIEVDSCEYVQKDMGYSAGFLFSHKGNCKHCIERISRVDPPFVVGKMDYDFTGEMPVRGARIEMVNGVITIKYTPLYQTVDTIYSNANGVLHWIETSDDSTVKIDK